VESERERTGIGRVQPRRFTQETFHKAKLAVRIFLELEAKAVVISVRRIVMCSGWRPRAAIAYET
jgi:hypothetical protein